MARPKIKKGSLTVPLVAHVPSALKKKIITAAKAKDLGVSQFVRETLTKVIR